MPSSQIPMQLHPLLSTTQDQVRDGIYAYTLWDLREHPVPNAQYVQQLGTSLGRTALSAPATNPPVDYLHITCDYPEPWDLIVTPSSSLSSPSHVQIPIPLPITPFSSPQSPAKRFITVYDVLRSIYYDLQTLIPESEFQALHIKQRGRVTEAFKKRSMISVGTSPEEALRGGLKKIDMLCIHTLFAGLSVDPEKQSQNTLILSLRRPH